MATNAPAGDPAWTLVPQHHGTNTYIKPWEPYPQPWTPDPYPPYTPPTVYPLTWPTITTTGTTNLRLMSKDVRDLLDLIHDELLASDDADHLALAELIEETLDQ